MNSNHLVLCEQNRTEQLIVEELIVRISSSVDVNDGSVLLHRGVY